MDCRFCSDKHVESRPDELLMARDDDIAKIVLAVVLALILIHFRRRGV